MPGLLRSDDVLPWMLARHEVGERIALVTVVGVEGGSPRGLGAQMAVSASGDYVGYLSGGCLEQAIAQEAILALDEGKNRLMRYGKDSKYFDIRLPCGSGLDIYIDQAIDGHILDRLRALRSTRTLASMRTCLATGTSDVTEITDVGDRAPGSERAGDFFTRVHVPDLRLLVVGIGPVVSAVSQIGLCAGMEVVAASPNLRTQEDVAALGLKALAMTGPKLPAGIAVDLWTAVVLAFHEHDWEPPLLQDLLSRRSFYIGAVGSRAVHQSRIDALLRCGVTTEDACRVRGPIGLISGAKGRTSLAIGVVAEIFAEAKLRCFIA